ncbi:unnamed protein product [Ambrosiozyma monospora]|uniref:Unnamed protein product n=1 Tax=Ambrosiozyma monospora TaxID=43982 RepID=A0ACB5TAD2_AMBMO|nr:unnamed protein product [Ambrosiozyma monospora]
MGKIGGCMSVQATEQWCQQWYFAFQVVQVFLVTTCTSAAASTISSIIKDPSKAMSLLGQYLPPASNFYISYLLLQGLSISSGALAQIVALILSFVLGRILDNTPRKKWNRYNILGTPSWGTTYAVYGLFTVILLCYSIIAPIIIAFTVVSYFLIYVAFLYNLTYVNGHTYDSRGRNYPLAMFEVFVGLYLAEICLMALFVMRKNWPCVILEAIFLGFTVGCHLLFRWLFEPLLDTVPVGAFREVDSGLVGAYNMRDQGLKEIKQEGKNYFSGPGAELNDDAATATGAPVANDPFSTPAQDNRKSFGSTDTNSQQGGYDKKNSLDTGAQAQGASANETDIEKTGQNGHFNVKQYAQPSTFSHMIKKLISPKKFLSFNYCRSIMPDSYMEAVPPSYSESITYDDPASVNEEPKIWFVRDSQGLSTQFLDKLDGKLLATDSNAVLEDDGKFDYTGNPPDYEEEVQY